MIFGITTSQQELMKKTIRRQQQINKELNFSQSSLDISEKRDISQNLPKNTKTSFSSFKSQQNDDKQGLRRQKTMGSITDIDKLEKNQLKKDKHYNGFFKIIENLLNC